MFSCCTTCCRESCTTNPQQIESLKQILNKLYNTRPYKNRPPTTNLDMSGCCTACCTTCCRTFPQQIEVMECLHVKYTFLQMFYLTRNHGLSILSHDARSVVEINKCIARSVRYDSRALLFVAACGAYRLRSDSSVNFICRLI